MDRLCAMFRWVMRAAFVALAMGAPANAANPPLRADVQPLALRPRTNAPSIIDIQLHSTRQAILEGVLELRIMSGSGEVYRTRTPELALAPGTLRHRILLPATTTSRLGGSRELEAQAFFVMKGQTHDLGRFPLTGLRTSARDYVIGVCTTGSGSPRSQPKLWQALRPEQLPPEDARGPMRMLGSVPVPFLPEDMPSAIGLCAFDVIAVEGASFAALTGKQLGALATWVEAGGSLCVVPAAPLDAEHLAFLNALATEPGKSAAVTLSPGSPLTIEGGPLLFRRPGLGRVVIASAVPGDETDPAAPQWTRVAPFLAKARTAQARVNLLQPWQRRYIGEDQDRVSAIQRTLFQHLPQRARMIPLPVIAAILGAFVLAVGPGEWFILGRLRGRRWTWVTFPLLAVGFTLLGVRTAEFYLGLNDKFATLIVTDVGRDGRVVRENRFELRMAGRDKIADLEMHQMLFAVCEPIDYSPSVRRPTPLYEGQIPGRYTMRLPLQQWNPVLVRTMTLGPGSEPLDIRWPEVKPGWRERLTEEDVRDGPWTLHLLEKRSSVLGRRRYSLWHEKLVAQISSLEGDDEPTSTTLAPSGQPDVLDLAIADETDPQEWMVFASKPIPSGLHIVRRLYHTTP